MKEYEKIRDKTRNHERVRLNFGRVEEIRKNPQETQRISENLRECERIRKNLKESKRIRDNLCKIPKTQIKLNKNRSSNLSNKIDTDGNGRPNFSYSKGHEITRKHESSRSPYYNTAFKRVVI